MPDMWRVVDKGDTCSAYHGIPLSNLYCFMYHRVLFESNAGDTRERTQKQVSGVYCYLSRLQSQLLWYSKWNVLSGSDIAYATYVQFTGATHSAAAVVRFEMAFPSYATRPMAIIV